MPLSEQLFVDSPPKFCDANHVLVGCGDVGSDNFAIIDLKTEDRVVSIQLDDGVDFKKIDVEFRTVRPDGQGLFGELGFGLVF